MTKIIDIESALAVFRESAIKQAEATEEGDYKTGNRNYNQIEKAAGYLRKKDALKDLKIFLDDSYVGVRLWASYYLLPLYEKESLAVLGRIVKETGIHSLTAETTISFSEDMLGTK